MPEHDPSNPQHVAKAEELEDDKLRDLDWVVSSVRGRRWVYNLLHETCHLMQNSLTSDPVFTASNEGARAVGLAVRQQLLNRSADTYRQMLMENIPNG